MKDENLILPSWSFTQNYKKSIHGTAPQHLIDTATRQKIYRSVYWNQYCFGVNLLLFVDRSQNLKGIGGLYGTYKHPSNFICLFLKLLELEPSEEIIFSFINTKSWQMKYLRLLAALYIRFVYSSDKIFEILEPLESNYNKIAVLTDNGYILKYFDEIIYSFLTEKIWFGIQFPTLIKSQKKFKRFSILSNLENKLKEEIYLEFGLNINGELIKNINKKKKIPLKKLFKKIKKIKINNLEENSIEEENNLRILLGLKPLK